jgi:predicted  nucleic acid-binding Zn-ribbon protein
MSVSARDRKSVIYSEVERLRHLLDQQTHQLRAAHEEIERLRARTQPQAPDTSERRSQIAALKAFSTKFRCTARLRNGVIELYSRKRQCWVAVPEGVQP